MGWYVFHTPFRVDKWVFGMNLYMTYFILFRVLRLVNKWNHDQCSTCVVRQLSRDYTSIEYENLLSDINAGTRPRRVNGFPILPVPLSFLSSWKRLTVHLHEN